MQNGFSAPDMHFLYDEKVGNLSKARFLDNSVKTKQSSFF